MGFASEYLSRRVLFNPIIETDPDKHTYLVVVIPACNEPDLIITLESLALCDVPTCGVEVIIHFNASGTGASDQLLINRETEEEIKSWNKLNKPKFRLFCINTGINNFRDWGAGMARKVAMDEALSRLNTIDKPGAVIVSLDADCSVAANYLTSLYSLFSENETLNACSVYFEHPIKGKDHSTEIYKAITLYELHLRYYYQALKYSGFPYVYHTVGSAFAVRAGVYARAGGMSRHQAGEDFYFIQKTIPMGAYTYLNSTCVYPSPRVSDRVPFGTGPAVSGIINSESSAYLTYNIKAFEALRTLFFSVPKLYKADDLIMDKLEKQFTESLKTFLVRDEWRKRIVEINSNTASEQAFIKRFFNWFNMFKVVKYLNWSHQNESYRKIEVAEAASELMGIIGNGTDSTKPADLLVEFRLIELP